MASDIVGVVGHAAEECDVLFALLSYSRRYWRKSLNRKTCTEAHSIEKIVHAGLFICTCDLCMQAAHELQAVLKHNAKRARPSKRKCKTAAAPADGPKEKQVEKQVRCKEECADKEIWEIADSSESDSCEIMAAPDQPKKPMIEALCCMCTCCCFYMYNNSSVFGAG